LYQKDEWKIGLWSIREHPLVFAYTPTLFLKASKSFYKNNITVIIRIRYKWNVDIYRRFSLPYCINLFWPPLSELLTSWLVFYSLFPSAHSTQVHCQRCYEWIWYKMEKTIIHAPCTLSQPRSKPTPSPQIFFYWIWTRDLWIGNPSPYPNSHRNKIIDDLIKFYFLVKEYT
jgi:hypothetical protein